VDKPWERQLRRPSPRRPMTKSYGTPEAPQRRDSLPPIKSGRSTPREPAESVVQAVNQMRLWIHTPDGNVHEVFCEPHITISCLQADLQQRTGIAVEEQLLFVDGNRLVAPGGDIINTATSSVADAGLKDGRHVQIVAGGNSAAALWPRIQERHIKWAFLHSRAQSQCPPPKRSRSEDALWLLMQNVGLAQASPCGRQPLAAVYDAMAAEMKARRSRSQSRRRQRK